MGVGEGGTKYMFKTLGVINTNETTIIKAFKSKPSQKVKLTTYLVGSNILSSIMQGVGSGIETGVAIAC